MNKTIRQLANDLDSDHGCMGHMDSYDRNLIATYLVTKGWNPHPINNEDCSVCGYHCLKTMCSCCVERQRDTADALGFRRGFLSAHNRSKDD